MHDENLIRESQQLRMLKSLIIKKLNAYSGIKYEELEIIAIMLGAKEAGDEE